MVEMAAILYRGSGRQHQDREKSDLRTGTIMAKIVLRGTSGGFRGRRRKSSSEMIVGRGRECHVVLDDRSVSRQHAQIRCSDWRWRVRDLGSTNGTFLNGVRMDEGEWPVREGDLLRFGEVEMAVESVIHPTASEMLKSAWAMGEGLTASSRIPLGPRKLRLLASACCRSEWQDIPVESTRLAERYVDGLASEEEFRSIFPVGHPLVWQVLNQAALSEALDVAERYADGIGTDEGLASARLKFDSLADDRRPEESGRCPLEPIRGMADVALAPGPIRCDDIFHDEVQTFLAHRPEDAMDGQTDYFGTESTTVVQADHLGADPSIWRAEYFPILEDMVGPLPSGSLQVDPSWLAWNDGVVPKLAHSIYDARSFADMPILGDALEDCGCTVESILRHCREPIRHFRGCWVLDLLTGHE